MLREQGWTMAKSKTCDMSWGVYRLIYAGFLTGRRINAVSEGAEMWFWRLYALADDFGNLPADLDLLKAKGAPMRRGVTPAKIKRWNDELAREWDEGTPGLISFYTVGREQYIHITEFAERQPAGRNGRRIHRVPIPPGESGGIRGNPGAVGAPHSDSHTHSDTDSHSDAQDQSSPTTPEDISSSVLPGRGTGGDQSAGGVDWAGVFGVRDALVGLRIWPAVIDDVMAWEPAATLETVRRVWEWVCSDKGVRDRQAVFVYRMYREENGGPGLEHLPAARGEFSEAIRARIVGRLRALGGAQTGAAR
jgi:hypothetical protein